MASAVPSFYNSALVNIWVEDSLTRDYLSAVWPDAPFHYLVTGGVAGATAMAKQAADDQLRVPVFAIVDRDLGQDNEAKWSDPTWSGVVFKPRVLEVENFLLDEASIAAAGGNAIRKTGPEILKLFLDRAEVMTWWMTCKQVLAEINRLRSRAFPADNLAHPDRPDRVVCSEDGAVALLRDCDWATTTLRETSDALTEPKLRARVQTAHRDVVAWLATDDWREQFSGKELYNWVYGQVSSGPRVRRPATMEALAAEIGTIQLETGRVPSSLRALHDSILQRTGLA